MKTEHPFYYISYVVIPFSSIVVIFLFFLLLFIFIHVLISEEFKEKRRKTYQLSNLNPVKSETSFGIVKISKELYDEEYLSYYNNELRSTSIISNFVDDEYECSGSCYCDEKNERRSSMVKRGMFIVLSAISTSMAISVASETFKNSCGDYFFEMCGKDNIKAEVNSCEEVNEAKEEEATDKIRNQRREYLCTGHCLPNGQNMNSNSPELDRMREGKSLSEARAEFGDCGRLSTSGRVEITVPFIEKNIQNSNKMGVQRFIVDYLKPFCRSQSLVKVEILANSDSDTSNYRYIWGQGKRGSGKYKGQSLYLKESLTSACSAWNKGDFKHVKCKITGKEFLQLI